jgi:ParB/RepB/Spo0J family partition protein
MNANVPAGALAVPTLPINDIVPSPSNPRKRIDDTYLQELASSIRELGLIQPITVRPMPLDHFFEYNKRRLPGDESNPTYEIIVGECRWRAAKIAGLTEIPAFWREIDDKQVLEIQVIENLQRRDVHPIEEADGYRQLIDRHGYTADEIGEKIGKSRSYVYGRMKLSSLGSKAREIFYDGQMEASVALLIARIPSEKDQERAVKELINQFGEEPITFRNAKWRIKNGFTIDLCQATFSPDDETLYPTAGSCTACPKRSGNSPELCPDLESTDVCTDLKCFEEKRLNRREQLIENAKQKKIPIYVGEDVNKVAPNGSRYNIDDKWVSLDDTIDDDPEDRTYRQVLGDKAPIGMIVEFGQGPRATLMSFAEQPALGEALMKAGYKPAKDETENQSSSTGSAWPFPNAKVDAKNKQRLEEQEKQAQLIKNEKERRSTLLQSIRTRLWDNADQLDTPNIINALVYSHIRQDSSYNDLDVVLLKTFGIELPADYEILEELVRIQGIVAEWPVATALAYLAVRVTEDERSDIWDYQAGSAYPATGLEMIARAAGIDASPSTAAQAKESSAPEKSGNGLTVGSRVRIRNDLDGTAAWKKAVCGKEGIVESMTGEGAYLNVRIAPGKAGLVENLVWNELEPLLPTANAAQAQDQTQIETNETPTGSDTGAGDGQAAVIETNVKPKGRGKAKAKAVA